MRHAFIHRFVFHSLINLSIYEMCFQRMIFMFKLYEPMNERTLHDFHY
jgi:hypothetical protein